MAEYLRRFAEAGLSWPLSASLSEAELEAKLFPPAPSVPVSERAEPDWAALHAEMRRPGVTLMLLWQEYRASHPQGFAYSWFCEHYRAWVGRLDLVMRQEHRAGEKLFVDFAGHTVPITDRDTGEMRPASIFVAVLGASNYTYAEATWGEGLPEWIGSHVRCFEFLGGVPEIVVPDNLKSAVSHAHRYEPELNASYLELARHYGVAVIPARAARPRDKAKAEAGVQLVQRWILARLRNRQFFSLAELNAAIAELLAQLNARPFKKLPGSRASAFEQIDRPALKALPAQPYEFAEWKKVRVHIDYHIEFARHYYSVAHALVGKELDARVCATTVELFHRGHARGQPHPLAPRRGLHHLSRAHARFAPRVRQVDPRAAARVGQHDRTGHRLRDQRHPRGSASSPAGLSLRAGRAAAGQALRQRRLEAVCQRAHTLHITTFKSIESMLKNNLDRTPLVEPAASSQLPLLHENIRGPEYYH